MQPLNKALCLYFTNTLSRMNERTRTIALLAYSYCYVATCSYRRANGGNSTHTSTGTTSSTCMAAAQLIHSGKNVHLTQSRRSRCLINILPCCTKLAVANSV